MSAVAETVAPTFYSKVEQAITEKMPAKASGADVLGLIKNTPGVRQEEIDWIGLPEFLKGKASVTKQQVIDFIKSNQVTLKEVMKGEQAAMGQGAQQQTALAVAQLNADNRIDVASIQALTQLELAAMQPDPALQSEMDEGD